MITIRGLGTRCGASVDSLLHIQWATSQKDLNDDTKSSYCFGSRRATFLYFNINSI